MCRNTCTKGAPPTAQAAASAARQRRRAARRCQPPLPAPASARPLTARSRQSLQSVAPAGSLAAPILPAAAHIGAQLQPPVGGSATAAASKQPRPPHSLLPIPPSTSRADPSTCANPSPSPPPPSPSPPLRRFCRRCHSNSARSRPSPPRLLVPLFLLAPVSQSCPALHLPHWAPIASSSPSTLSSPRSACAAPSPLISELPSPPLHCVQHPTPSHRPCCPHTAAPPAPNTIPSRRRRADDVAAPAGQAPLSRVAAGNHHHSFARYHPRHTPTQPANLPAH